MLFPSVCETLLPKIELIVSWSTSPVGRGPIFTGRFLGGGSLVGRRWGSGGGLWTFAVVGGVAEKERDCC